jgi:hypothetical protein
MTKRAADMPLARQRGNAARRNRRKEDRRAGNTANAGGTDDGLIPHWIRRQSERAKATRKDS